MAKKNSGKSTTKKKTTAKGMKTITRRRVAKSRASQRERYGEQPSQGRKSPKPARPN